MKSVLILFIGILIISCNQTKKENQNVDSKSENLDWLLGNWKRLNEAAGKETFENWEKISDSEYFGIGFTMQNGDTLSQEQMVLTQMNGKWNLAVKLSTEPESITFTGKSHNENEFICINNENDFPNTIKYWKNGDRINALVSGGDMEIPFEFEKMNK